MARVNALLRRANKLGKEAVISETGGIVMDKTAHTVACLLYTSPEAPEAAALYVFVSELMPAGEPE